MKLDLTTTNLTLNQIQTIIDSAGIAMAVSKDQAVASFPDGNWTEYDLNSVAIGQAILYFKNLYANKSLELNLMDMENTIEYLSYRSQTLEQFYQKMDIVTDDITTAMANIHNEIIKLRKQLVLAKKINFPIEVPQDIYQCIIKFDLYK
jgi:hypothetical protein